MISQTLWLDQLPNRWPVGRIKDHVALINGFPFDSQCFSQSAGTRLVRIRDLTDGGELTYVDIAVPMAAMIDSGDLVVGMDGDFNVVTWSGGPAALNQRLCVLRARPSLDQRFLGYLLAMPLKAINDVTYFTTVKHLSSGDLLGERIPVPPLHVQRAIADYLDRETARIDALIAAKRRMVELLEERWQGLLENCIRTLAARHGEISLKHVCREVVVGIVITPSAWYAETGIPAIRGTNVSPGSISLDDLVYLTPEGHALHPKSRLHAGDVLVVRTGQAGAAAVVPQGLDGANCIDLVIVRLARPYSPHFLEFVLNSDWMQKHIDEHSVGTIQSHFNVGAAGVVPVPLAPASEQESAIKALRSERQRITGLSDVVGQQIALLQQRRQALITAAVTGQVDLPLAA